MRKKNTHCVYTIRGEKDGIDHCGKTIFNASKRR